MSRFEAIVFDFDGVLVESVDVKTRAFAALYAGHAEAFMAEVAAFHLANGGLSRFAKFRHYQALLGRPPLAPAEEQALSERFSRLVLDAVVAAPFVTGAKEALDHFRGRLPLFVASGTPDGELAEIVGRRGMGSYFVSVHGSPARKGEILAAIAARHGLAPARMLMVGDAGADLEGARAAGTAFLGRVPPGEVNRFPPEVEVVADLLPLPGLIEAQ